MTDYPRDPAEFGRNCAFCIFLERNSDINLACICDEMTDDYLDWLERVTMRRYRCMHFTPEKPTNEELYEIECDRRLHAWKDGDYGDIPLSQVPKPRRPK